MNATDAKIPRHLDLAISTPHAHEDESHRPLWIIWKHVVASDGLADAPAIDSIADSEDMARYLVGDILQSNRRELTVFVERIPANHRFASSMADVFHDHTLTQIRMDRHRRSVAGKFSYRRDGD